MEKEISVANRAADAARQALETETREQRQRMAALAFKDPARLAPKIAFTEARGLLPLPVRDHNCVVLAKMTAQAARRAEFRWRRVPMP
jgi:septal ring factor EnvC (AmiA/AmiB activator)